MNGLQNKSIRLCRCSEELCVWPVGWALLLFLALPTVAGVTNAVPWADSFESYAPGTALNAINGWESLTVVVTNAAGPMDALTNSATGYAASYAYPLSEASHTNIAVVVNDLLANTIRSSSGGVTVLDLLAMPSWSDTAPSSRDGTQGALYINTNGHVVVWQRSPSMATNVWLELAGGPVVSTGVWTRFTLIQNYSGSLYAVCVNGGSPISDVSGYQADGIALNGPWFHMAQTNGVLSKVILGEGGTNYVDDIVITNRILSWSPGGWSESVTNNGTINNSTPVTVTLLYDTFEAGDDFTSHVQVDSGLPPGLALVARRTSDTTVVLTLTNAAVDHAAINSVSNLTVHFTPGAFTLGHASDIIGVANTALSVTFRDSPVLAYSAMAFTEASPPNDGSMDNTTPLTMTLTGDAFTGTDGEDFAANPSKLVITGMPDGLTGQVVKVDDTHLQMTLQGKAVAHFNYMSTAIALVFQGGAFQTNIVTGSVSNGTATVQVQYLTAPSLAYGATAFSELTMGMIDNRIPMTITLSGDSFVADADFTSHVTVSCLPPGLSVIFTRVCATQLTVTVSGAATANAAVNTLHDLGFTFKDGAFVNAMASQVAGYSRSNLTILFMDDAYYVNYIPYRESFEGYANGTLLAGTNGWVADYYADAGQVTNAVGLTALLEQYQGSGKTYPITTNHTRVLKLNDTLGDEIHSSAGMGIYVDFLMVPVALSEEPAGNTNLQFAFYVNTNRQLVVWHRNTTGGSEANEWRTLTNNVPLIDTNTWSRFTVTANYTNMMFQVQVNEGVPASDPVGWSADGVSRTGSWFHMVNPSSNALARIRFNGVGGAFVDDLCVVADWPANFGVGIGSVFKFR